MSSKRAATAPRPTRSRTHSASPSWSTPARRWCIRRVRSTRFMPFPTPLRTPRPREVDDGARRAPADADPPGRAHDGTRARDQYNGRGNAGRMTNGRARARLTAGGTSLVSLVSLASLTAFARTAGATPSARLVYSRAQSASSCPDEPALRKAVAARIGYDPFFGWAKKTVVVRMVPADGPGYVASVDLVDDEGYEHGARQIRTEGKCAELRDPVALAIAI